MENLKLNRPLSLREQIAKEVRCYETKDLHKMLGTALRFMRLSEPIPEEIYKELRKRGASITLPKNWRI